MKIRNQLTTIDHHHGQASRTVVAGYPPIKGRTMRDKAQYYLDNMSWIHESLIREPRGHKNMLGAILTEPTSEDGDFGLLYLHANGLFEGCGDSTFCAATAAIETGRVATIGSTANFKIDTVNGPLLVNADVLDGVVSEVRLVNVPSYFVRRVELPIEGKGAVAVDIAFGGNYFGFVDAGSVGLRVNAESESKFVKHALELWKGLEKLSLPMDIHTGAPSKIDLFTFVESCNENHWRVANVYKPGCMGRTPSGTGTSAHIALRYATGELAIDKMFIQESVLGLQFKGAIKEHMLPTGKVVLPTIGTKSYLMGVHQFYIDKDDPYSNGFILNG
jgi:proline racemase